MTNIPKQLQVNNSDFIVGDTVVFTEEKSCDCDLYEVEAVLNVNLNTQSWFNFKSHFLLILEVLNEFTPLKRGLQGASKGVWRA